MDQHFVLAAGTLLAGLVTGAFRLAYIRFKKTGIQDAGFLWSFFYRGAIFRINSLWRRRISTHWTSRFYLTDRLKNTGHTMMVPGRPPEHLSVDEMFVPLLLSDGGRGVAEYQSLLRGYGRRNLILGDPGSGKSSLVKRLFREACRAALQDPSNSQTPILIELKDMPELLEEFQPTDQVLGHVFFDKLITNLRTGKLYSPAEAVENLKQDPGYLFLLDGLDEVPSARSLQVVRAVLKLSRYLSIQSPESSILITARTQFYNSLFDRDFDETFSVLTVRSFTNSDIFRFVSMWKYKGTEPTSEITRIYSRITSQPSLAQMCSNPLMLSMYVSRDQAMQGSDLPETKTSFYAAVIEELLVNRRSRTENEPRGRERLERARKTFLGRVCWEHLSNSFEPANSIPLQKFNAIAQRLRQGGEDRLRYISRVASDTGLFAEERPAETMRFLHLTLCEFLAAGELVERGVEGWQDIQLTLADDSISGALARARLSQVIAFAAGVAGRKLREVMLRDLARLELFELLLIACLESQNYDSQEFELAVQKEIASLRDDVTLQASWNMRMLRMVGILRDVHLGYRPESGEAEPTVPDAVSFISDLMQVKGDVVLPVLARLDIEAAVAVAAESPEGIRAVVSSVEEPPVLHAVLAGIAGGKPRWAEELLRLALRQRRVTEAIIQDRGIWSKQTLFSARLNQSASSAFVHSKKWTKSSLVETALYGQILDLGLAATRYMPDVLLRQLPAPRWRFQFALESLVRGTLAAAAAGLATGLVASPVVGFFNKGSHWPRPEYCVGVALIAFGGWVALRLAIGIARFGSHFDFSETCRMLGLREFLYMEVLNLRPFDSYSLVADRNLRAMHPSRREALKWYDYLLIWLSPGFLSRSARRMISGVTRKEIDVYCAFAESKADQASDRNSPPIAT
jgi:NACHT domain